MPAKGAGKGDGWGGPPKGAGRGPKLGPKPANKAPNWTAQPPRGSPEKIARRKKAKADKAARIEQFNNELADLALNAPRDETRLSALIAALNRLDGLPIATQRNLNTEVTLEQMVVSAAKLRGTSGA
jgi:hypothetical protein